MDNIREIIMAILDDCLFVTYNVGRIQQNCDYIAQKYLERGDISTAADLYMNYNEECDKVYAQIIEEFASVPNCDKRIVPFTIGNGHLINGKEVIAEEKWDFIIVKK